MSTRRAERKASPLFEIARVLVRFDHVASYFQTAGQFLKRRESKKVSHFWELRFAVSVETRWEAKAPCYNEGRKPCHRRYPRLIAFLIS